LQRLTDDRVEAGYSLDQRQPGLYRAVGIVLVGPRIAEIREHTVPNVLGDKPAGPFDDRGDATHDDKRR
jgi:hypothetical protein